MSILLNNDLMQSQNPPEFDIVKERGLVEIHEAAVIVDLLPVVLLGGVEEVVAGHHGGQGPVLGLDDGAVVSNLHDVAEDEPGLGVPHPHFVPVHRNSYSSDYFTKISAKCDFKAQTPTEILNQANNFKLKRP